MNARIWFFWLVFGILLNIADTLLTIELLDDGLFFEANPVLSWMFAEGRIWTIHTIKCLGWVIVLGFALQRTTKRWVTPQVVALATLGLAVIVTWNAFWVVHIHQNFPFLTY